MLEKKTASKVWHYTAQSELVNLTSVVFSWAADKQTAEMMSCRQTPAAPSTLSFKQTSMKTAFIQCSPFPLGYNRLHTITLSSLIQWQWTVSTEIHLMTSSVSTNIYLKATKSHLITVLCSKKSLMFTSNVSFNPRLKCWFPGHSAVF